MPSDLARSDGSSRIRPNGFSLLECMVVAALLGILATLAIPSSSAVQRRLELDSGLRRLRVGLDRGRMAAERDRQPCALQLTSSGWQPPLTGDLPACRGGRDALGGDRCRRVGVAQQPAGCRSLQQQWLGAGWRPGGVGAPQPQPCPGVVPGDRLALGDQPQWCLSGGSKRLPQQCPLSPQ